MALVSGNNSLFMMFTKLPDHKIYVARRDVSDWTVYTESPWEHYWPGAVYHSGALHVIAGKTLDSTRITRSTAVTAGLKQWSSTMDTVVDSASTILPASPVPLADPTITVCQDTMYMTGGYTDDANDTLPVYRLSSIGSQLTWKRSKLPETPTRVGCASYQNWLWLTGGKYSGKGTILRDAYCVQPSTNDVIMLQPLPSKRQLSSVTVFNGTLMVSGGGDGKKWHHNIFTLDLTE